MDAARRTNSDRPGPRAGGGLRGRWMARFRREPAVELTFDMGPVRRKFGDKWNRVAPSVRRFAALVIDRHVDDRVQVVLKGDVFFLRFAGVRPRAAARRLRLIETELGELLFGSGLSDERTLTSRPAGSARAATARRGTGAEASAVARPDPAESWWNSDAVPELPGRRPAPGAPRPAPARAVAGPERDGRPVFVDDPKREYAPASSRDRGRVRRSGTDALEQALHAAILEAERRNDLAQKARLFPPMGTRFLYRPRWLVERGVLPIYTCTPACALGPFEFVTGEALLSKGVGARKIAMLDEMLLDHVARELQPRTVIPMGATICIPVHYETLTGERAHIYMQELGKIPQSVRGHLAVEIIGISPGVGQLSTYSLVRKLRAHVRTVTGRLDVGDVNFRVWRQTDLSCVGIDIENDSRPEIELMHDLNNFVAPARQHNLRTYVRGLRTFSLAAAAVASGVDLLDGPAIAEGDLVLPDETRPFGIMDIYTAA